MRSNRVEPGYEVAVQIEVSKSLYFLFLVAKRSQKLHKTKSIKIFCF